MSIPRIIQQRGISEVLHFTTDAGMLGILDTKSLSSRLRLSTNERLEFILKVNAEFRKDTEWLDYVNLSISRINSNFLAASRRWHPEVNWRILALDPDLMTHEGVYFSTTNNFYPSAKRAMGPDGLAALFSDVVLGRYGAPVRRKSGMPTSWPTCIQAEVLYPRYIATDYLKRIYVTNAEQQDDVCAQLAAVNHAEIDVVINVDVFGGKID